ncbi:hypothetical protein MLD38_002629 [Melastoma candidum]|uniref:Uncharacterized protein n=1 Tax=Melastoma candidum TaxID=119954 RepID=A0ACB9S018_9MYRT|nr:hypothetical protein MLD38_002629 [Melastoma candidum]
MVVLYRCLVINGLNCYKNCWLLSSLVFCPPTSQVEAAVFIAWLSESNSCIVAGETPWNVGRFSPCQSGLFRRVFYCIIRLAARMLSVKVIINFYI